MDAVTAHPPANRWHRIRKLSNVRGISIHNRFRPVDSPPSSKSSSEYFEHIEFEKLAGLDRPFRHGYSRKLGFTALKKLVSRTKCTRSKGEKDSCDIAPQLPLALSGSCKFKNLFFALPHELRLQVFDNLSMEDIYALRLSCRRFYYFVLDNQRTLTREMTLHSDWVTPLCRCLYPLPTDIEEQNLTYLFTIRHRHQVVDKLSSTLARFVVDQVYSGSSRGMREMRLQKFPLVKSRLYSPLLTIHHFFESYRLLVCLTIQHHISLMSVDDDERSLPAMRMDIGESLRMDQEAILDEYSTDSLLFTHQVYRFLFMTFFRQLRPPSYTDSFERTIRGWTRNPASRSEVHKLVVFGGLREVARILSLPTYMTRRKRLDSFIASLSEEPIDEWDGRMTLLQPSLIKAERTMPIIPLEDVQTILPFLPHLHNAWTPAVHQRLIINGIIASPEEISMSTQFLQELVLDPPAEGNSQENAHETGQD